MSENPTTVSTDDPFRGVLIAPARAFEYLVGRKTRGDHPGLITTPGGWMKLRERPIVAAVREYCEETGQPASTIDGIAHLGVVQDGEYSTHLYIGTYFGLAYRLDLLTTTEGITDWHWRHEDVLIRMAPTEINPNLQALACKQKESRERRLRNGGTR